MKYCAHCGKELLDDAVICMGCGCPAENPPIEPQTEPEERNPKKGHRRINFKIVIPIAVVILALVFGILYFRFWRQPDTEITLDDLLEPCNEIQALIKYGAPDVGDPEDYAYFDRVTLEGVEIDDFSIEFDEDYDYRIITFSCYDEQVVELVALLLEKAELIGQEESYIETCEWFILEYKGMEIRWYVSYTDAEHTAISSMSFEFTCE